LSIDHYNDELVFVDIIAINDLVNYLYDNMKCNYIAFPVYHHYHINNDDKKKNNSSHISLLLFDNLNQLIYHIDSNGVSKKNIILEKVIQFHMNIINECGFNYSFIKSEIWNHDKVYLNVNYHHDELNDKGNCVTWTFLITKLICETLKSPYEILDEIEKLNNDEKIYILKEYRNIILANFIKNKKKSSLLNNMYV
jgi:hypothetical protein